jgi:hypothetical protein
MDSKERLLKCIKHEPIDRVPVSTYALIDWHEIEPSYQAFADYIKTTRIGSAILARKLSPRNQNLLKKSDGTKADANM